MNGMIAFGFFYTIPSKCRAACLRRQNNYSVIAKTNLSYTKIHLKFNAIKMRNSFSSYCIKNRKQILLLKALKKTGE
jgi:hypothetical protein